MQHVQFWKVETLRHKELASEVLDLLFTRWRYLNEFKLFMHLLNPIL